MFSLISRDTRNPYVRKNTELYRILDPVRKTAEIQKRTENRRNLNYIRKLMKILKFDFKFTLLYIYRL